MIVVNHQPKCHSFKKHADSFCGHHAEEHKNQIQIDKKTDTFTVHSVFYLPRHYVTAHRYVMPIVVSEKFVYRN